MKLVQISVFLENRAGRLAEVTRVLGDAGTNIRALSLADTSDFGILRLIVDKTDDVMSLLKSKGFTASITEVTGVEVADEPGGLSEVLTLLERGRVNVEYMYAFVERFSDNALLVFRFEDPDRAAKVLAEGGIRVLSGEDFKSL